MLRRRVVIRGNVQGVGFRQSTLLESGKYPGISGYVKNLPSGEVEAVFEGEDSAVLALVAWCRRGPIPARVDRLDVIEEPVGSETQPRPGEFKIL